MLARLDIIWIKFEVQGHRLQPDTGLLYDIADKKSLRRFGSAIARVHYSDGIRSSEGPLTLTLNLILTLLILKLTLLTLTLTVTDARNSGPVLLHRVVRLFTPHVSISNHFCVLKISAKHRAE